MSDTYIIEIVLSDEDVELAKREAERMNAYYANAGVAFSVKWRDILAGAMRQRLNDLRERVERTG